MRKERTDQSMTGMMARVALYLPPAGILDVGGEIEGWLWPDIPLERLYPCWLVLVCLQQYVWLLAPRRVSLRPRGIMM